MDQELKDTYIGIIGKLYIDLDGVRVQRDYWRNEYDRVLGELNEMKMDLILGRRTEKEDEDE